MNAILFSLLASLFTAISSLCFRKNTDRPNSNCRSSGYLVIFYITAFTFSFLLYPEIFKAKVSFIMLSLGACVGLLSSTLMLLTSRALQKGPAGLTFAFQNASAIFPGLILFLALGSPFGFSSSYMQFIGIIIALFGLFWGAQSRATESSATSNISSYASWLKITLACFAIQILALTLIQSRCLLFNCQELGGFFSALSITEKDDVWFMPGQFGASLMMQGIIFLSERSKLEKSEVTYGFLGGICNFLSTFLLLLATKFALPVEKVIIFPCFAITSLVLCNIWANRLYKEKFNLPTNFLCAFGIFMAST